MKIRMVLAAAALLLLGLVTASPASAQYTGGNPPAAGPAAARTLQVQGAFSPVNVQVGSPTAQAQTRRAARTGGVGVTGADIAQMVLIGGALVVGGGLLARRSRQGAPNVS